MLFQESQIPFCRSWEVSDSAWTKDPVSVPKLKENTTKLKKVSRVWRKKSSICFWLERLIEIALARWDPLCRRRLFLERKNNVGFFSQGLLEKSSVSNRSFWLFAFVPDLSEKALYLFANVENCVKNVFCAAKNCLYDWSAVWQGYPETKPEELFFCESAIIFVGCAYR